MSDPETNVEEFINRWRGVTASELSTAQTFVLDLCELLAVEKPHPTPSQEYMFERPVEFRHGDGSLSSGRIDCYRRGHFVLEAKKVRSGSHTRGFDDALLRARAQAEGYARALPAADGRPPFLIVVDVGNVIELYAEFTRTGGTYTPFPDSRSHRIRLADLKDQSLRDRLALIWTDPMRLDPSRVSAKVTRAVAAQLAGVARSLEEAGHSPSDVAAFLTRCLFSMFAEDVELLPRTSEGDGAFVDLLKRFGDQPATLQRMIDALWTDMDRGGFSAALAMDVLRFNGKLFKRTPNYVLPLNQVQIDGLLAAARSNWREVEPSIFGTLLERALDPGERHRLGAHYTPRAYVERLVIPTVVEPLRTEWANAQAAALLLANEANDLDGRKRDDKLAEARAEIRRFHHVLCTSRILDPACGSGNFLYVTLEHLKRLEGEVIDQLELLGDSQARLHLEGETVTLQQLRGIEVNERAAAVAELVLWIGYLQWHIRTFGTASVAEPVVHDYGNIEHRDAVLAYDRQELMTDESGDIVTRWDGVSFKLHPTTGEEVPDDSARIPQWRYVNPRQPQWPEADFIVGNPPFIGNKRMREALGDGYVEALRAQWQDVPDTSDFVMYWWDRAALLARQGNVKRFGFITTNSLRQTFNRQVIQQHLSAQPPLSLRFVVPDHPWVDSSDGAAVRIAMSVGIAGESPGEVLTVVEETAQDDGEVAVKMDTRRGSIHADLAIGANVAGVKKLKANTGICYQGFVLVGEGFILTEGERQSIAANAPSEMSAVRAWKNGRDLSRGSRGHSVIDLFPLTEEQARATYPHLYQHLLDRVKPFRDEVARRNHRERWWIWGEARPGLRAATAGLPRIIVTNFAAKHRYFVFEHPRTALDHNMYVIGSSDALLLGVLSSRVHVLWMLRAGSTLEDRPLWINSTCFLPFPFPNAHTGLTPALGQRIRELAEQLDAHRKARQAAHDDVTLTGMYNVMAKLERGASLTPKERRMHEHGLVGVLKSLHEELDEAVLAAYGWSDLVLPRDKEALFERLVELNAERADEEASGIVHWLRPEFQNRAARLEQAELPEDVPQAATPIAVAPVQKRQWPTRLPEQIKAIADVLSSQPTPLGMEEIAGHFTSRGRWRDRLPTILDTLQAVGRATRTQSGRWTSSGGR